jgi:hypothetical protein
MANRLYPLNRRRLPGREAYVVTALRRKYAELNGLGDTDAMAHVGATLRLYKPSEDLDAIPTIRPYRPQRSKYLADAMRVLRQTNEPMTARAIARRVLEARGVLLILGNLQRVECSLHAVLERLEGEGVVRVGDDPKRWALGD